MKSNDRLFISRFCIIFSNVKCVIYNVIQGEISDGLARPALIWHLISFVVVSFSNEKYFLDTKGYDRWYF